MTDDVKLFEDNQSLPAAVVDVATDLVGEGKKYQNAEEALKALVHAQQHIERIETENSVLRSENAKAKTLEEVLEAVKKPVQTEHSETPVSNEPDMKQLIAEELNAYDYKKTAEENGKVVANMLRAKYGEKAEEIFKSKAMELGKNVSDFEDMARRDPKLVLATFGQSIPQYSPALAASGTVRVEDKKYQSYKDDPRFLALAKEGNYQKLNALYQEYNS